MLFLRVRAPGDDIYSNLEMSMSLWNPLSLSRPLHLTARTPIAESCLGSRKAPMCQILSSKHRIIFINAWKQIGRTVCTFAHHVQSSNAHCISNGSAPAHYPSSTGHHFIGGASGYPGFCCSYLKSFRTPLASASSHRISTEQP